MEFLTFDTSKSITNVVAGMVFEEISLSWGFKSQLEKLRERLLDTQALMNDLASAEHAEKSELVVRWIQKLEGVAISAENLMDDYAYEMLRREREVRIKERCRSCLNPVLFRARMMHRVKKMMSNLDQLYTDPNIVGLQLARKAVASASNSATSDSADANLYQIRRLATASREEFIGREEDEERLLGMLLSPVDIDLHIIPIVGFGGLGKTTLARRIFEHEKVDGHFMGKKVWISVSKDFSVDRILKEMIETFAKKKCELTNTDTIIDELKTVLIEKKYFMVLDDVWNDNKERWDSVKASLRKISGLTTGNTILITTRYMTVANSASTFPPHELEGLSTEKGWELLKRLAFDETNMPGGGSFDVVGEQIVSEKCKGVPLAIKLIGGLLQSKKQLSEWESVKNSELWNIKSDDKNYIMPSLLLSYNHLRDVYVKKCFAYCSILPKDSVMEKGQLIALWLAQGLLHDEAEIIHNTEEKIGENFINTLVKYSFFQEENYGRQTRYKMHDLVHDLATYVSKTDSFVWTNKVKGGDVNSRIQHLTLNSIKSKKDEIEPAEPLAEKKMRRLRTISIWNKRPSWNFLICARYMRTLVMDNVGLIEVSSDIGQLVHLRYLDLSDNEIKALPESLCNLYQLQTLRLLRCNKLKKLPRKLHRLENLRYIETSNPVFASRGLRKLTSLRVLPHLQLRDGEGWITGELGYLDQLTGVVCISGLEHLKSKDEARKAGFKKNGKIRKLKISWGLNSEGKNDEDVLGGLEPHPNIEMLHIDRFKGEMFPEWIMTTMSVKQSEHPTQLIYLTEVKLSNCILCKKLPSLGALPKLTILKLEEFDKVECIGDEFHKNERNIDDGKVVFPALRELRIIKFKNLTSWMISSTTLASNAFPRLETLWIEDCKQLKSVTTFKLKSLQDVSFKKVGGNEVLDIIKGSPNLKYVDIKEMGEIERLPKELSNSSNLQKLEINTCEKLKCIPSGMTSLRELHVWRCPSLHIVEDDVLHGLYSLRELRFDDCSGLKKVAKCLEYCTSLEHLWISKCPLIEDPVPDIGKLQGLRKLKLKDVESMINYLSRWIPQLDRLQELTIGGWEQEWDMSLTSNLSSLKWLTLRHCPNLKSHSVQRHQQVLPPSLLTLSIFSFTDMEVLPNWIGYHSSLRELQVWNCLSLRSVEDGVLHGLSSLDELRFDDCSKLKMMAMSLEGCTSLKNLYIHKCPLIEDPVPDIGKLQGLRKLWLNDAGNMMAHLPQWIPQLHCLIELTIGGWGEEWDMSLTSTLSSLKYLTISDCPNLKALPKRQRLLPPSLQTLTIELLKEMEELPNWIGYVSSLQELRLRNCNKLKYLPSKKAMLRLSRLQALLIHNCSLLKERCLKDSGTEWPKICHIPTIKIS